MLMHRRRDRLRLTVRQKNTRFRKSCIQLPQTNRPCWIGSFRRLEVSALPISLTWRALTPFKRWRRRRSRNPPKFLNQGSGPIAARLGSHRSLAGFCAGRI